MEAVSQVFNVSGGWDVRPVVRARTMPTTVSLFDGESSGRLQQ
jgi:hypothetical protein